MIDLGASPNTPNYADEAVQGLLRQYSERARNLSDVIALISLDGFGDPTAPLGADSALSHERAVYNRADPYAVDHLRGPNGEPWSQLTDLQKNAAIRSNFDNLVGRYLNASGEFLSNDALQLRINVLRDITGDALGQLEPAHRAIMERIIRVAAVHNIDLLGANAKRATDVIRDFGGEFSDLDARLVREVVEVGERGVSLDVVRLLKKAGPRLLEGLSIVGDVADAAELGLAITLTARGQVHAGNFGQGNWDAWAAAQEIARRGGLDAHWLLGSLPVDAQFTTDASHHFIDLSRSAEIEAWLRSRYNIPAAYGVALYADSTATNGARYVIYREGSGARQRALADPAKYQVSLGFQVPLGQNVPGSDSAVRIALVPDPSGRAFQLVDYERNTVTTVYDPSGLGRQAVADALAASTPEARAAAEERVRAFSRVGIERPAATLAQSGGNRNAAAGQYAAGDFEAQTLFGNIATAQDYAQYLQNPAVINALMGADPLSAYSAGWTITFARVIELGLDKRWSTDWQGGWAAFLDETADGRIDGSAGCAANDNEFTEVCVAVA